MRARARNSPHDLDFFAMETLCPLWYQNFQGVPQEEWDSPLHYLREDGADPRMLNRALCFLFQGLIHIIKAWEMPPKLIHRWGKGAETAPRHALCFLSLEAISWKSLDQFQGCARNLWTRALAEGEDLDEWVRRMEVENNEDMKWNRIQEVDYHVNTFWVPYMQHHPDVMAQHGNNMKAHREEKSVLFQDSPRGRVSFLGIPAV